MQILDFAKEGATLPQALPLPPSPGPDKSQFFHDETGNYINSYLISTKSNDANWRIHKSTGHEKVKTFLNRDFPIIPELIKTPPEKGGGGHVRGTKEEVLRKYADNSHGKIIKILGPYYYKDGTDDYYYRAITKLSNSRAAAALVEHGKDTWIPYSVSPHIFIKEGNDLDGWTDWEGAGLCLVIKGAFGEESIITKLCKGSESQCMNSLVASTTETLDKTLAQIISSHISKFASSQQSDMSKEQSNDALSSSPPAQMQGTGTGTGAGGAITNSTQDPQRAITGEQVYQGPPRAEQPKTPEMVSIPADKLALLTERAESFTDMENERKTEIMTTIFKDLISDDKELSAEVKEYSKLDMKTVKILRSFHEAIGPRIAKATEARLKAAGNTDTTDNEKGDKDSKDKGKRSRTASIGNLRPERERRADSDSTDQDQDDSREASVPSVNNELYLLREKLGMNRFREVK